METMQLPRGLSTVWMAKLLNISGNEVIIFHELFFITRKGEHSYYEGVQRLAEDNNLSERTVRRIINGLVDKKLIEKTKEDDGGTSIEITPEAKRKIYGENCKTADKMSAKNDGQNVRSNGQIVQDDGQNVRCEIIGSSLNSESLKAKSLKISVNQSVSHNTCGSAREECENDGQHENDDKLTACESKTVPEFVDWLYSNKASEKLKSEMRNLAVTNVLPSWEMNAILSYCMDQSRYPGTLPSTVFIQKVIDRISRSVKPKNPQETLSLLIYGTITEKKPAEPKQEEPVEWTQEELDFMNELDKKMGGGRHKSMLFPEGEDK